MFIPILPLYQATLLSSVSTTSFTLFSNTAGRTMGIVPLINQKYEPFPITPKQKVKAWNSNFSRAMFWGIGVSVASAVGVSSLLIGPITFASGLPAINSELLSLGKQDLLDDERNKQASMVYELVEGWEKRHNIRFISYTGGWLFSTAALMTTLAR